MPQMHTSHDAVKPLKMALLDSRRCEPGRPREQAPLPKKKEGICGTFDQARASDSRFGPRRAVQR